ncbi:gamma-glutamyltranspeptidase [Chytriomyces cf. hyalinus JEL632]|nr:gamma-glutamyltranspeptidase [Chytriomyces cf. hyalinus JEL632]
MYQSRRSNVCSTGGMVASSQPLASDVGRAILARGGNAADAAVAVAATLAVTEPCSTGIGGDAFCLFYNAKSRSVQALNASGRCPAGLDLALLRSWDAHSVTVPGAAAGWVDTVKMFGSGNLTMHEILAPAIRLAQDGYPVSDLTAYFWGRGEEPPRAGELMKMPNYAKTMLSLAEHGKAGFYEGPVAEAIVSTLRELGSVIALEDLKRHASTAVEPICIEYDGALKLYECPPNGQGITALIALGILEALQKETSTDFIEKGLNSVEYLHTLIESMRLAFADSQHYVTDPDVVHVPVKELLSKNYLSRRAKLVDTDRASVAVKNSSDTVYFSVVDKDGNACSFINSNYEGFGSAIVPTGCGFPLQNRGSNFILDETHPNCLAPGKRTYHTIIPAMVTHMDDSLHMCYGVMGGFMQPQGHVQVLMNMHHFKMLPQAALDAPRFCIMPEKDGVSVVLIEEGIDEEVVEGLKLLGHDVQALSGQQRANFGRGQIILRQVEAESIAGHVLVGGCDPRSDGIVAPAQ